MKDVLSFTRINDDVIVLTETLEFYEDTEGRLRRRKKTILFLVIAFVVWALLTLFTPTNMWFHLAAVVVGLVGIFTVAFSFEKQLWVEFNQREQNVQVWKSNLKKEHIATIRKDDFISWPAGFVTKGGSWYYYLYFSVTKEQAKKEDGFRWTYLSIPGSRDEQKRRATLLAVAVNHFLSCYLSGDESLRSLDVMEVSSET